MINPVIEALNEGYGLTGLTSNDIIYRIMKIRNVNYKDGKEMFNKNKDDKSISEQRYSGIVGEYYRYKLK